MTKSLNVIGNRFIKRMFDLFFSLIGLSCIFWLLTILFVLASLDTKSFGIFSQVRVGKNGRHFRIFKIKTMIADMGIDNNITTSNDPRVTSFGRFLRKYKLDELPQLFNVLIGDMSFVGPRPDVPGYADALEEKQRLLLLSVRPGITGPASLAYRDEEALLAEQLDPRGYNDNIIYPHKVNINLHYITNWRFRNDIFYILKTLFR
jgi:lipopolysaccharide/colanic/teichoic acid biosynthesis glycosyltransferase